MISKIFQNKKWRRSVAGLLAAVVILVVPLTTQAQGVISGIVNFFAAAIGEASFFGFILAIINMVVDFIGVILIGLAASIVNYTFNFPNFVTAPVVQIGWSVSRDLANMTFILVMLGIAFAYILDLDIYGVKKMIVPLIIMALLLNFSLIIGGVFIDIGNSLGKFFVSGGAGNSTGVGDGIMAAVQAGQLAQIRNNVAASSPISNLIMASVLQLVFYIILAFMLFAMGFVMLYRIVNLWVLLILAPLAWVCVAIPNLKSYYSNWWSKFLKWAFYPVGLGFFVYIGTLAGASLFGADLSKSGFVRDTGGLAWLLPDTSISLVLQFIVVIMILMMGLAVSESWAGKSGKMVMDWGKSAKDWGLGKIKTRATTGASRLGQYALFGKSPTTGQATEPRAGTKIISRIPLVGKTLTTPMALIEQRKKQIADTEGKYDKLSNQAIQLAWGTANSDDRVGMAKVLAKRGQLKEVPGLIKKDEIGAAMKRATVLGIEKEMIISAPEIAIENNIVNNNPTATVDRVKKTMAELKPEDIKKISDDVFRKLSSNPASSPYYNQIMEGITKNWSGRHIGNMADAGQQVNIRELETYFRTLGATETDRLVGIERLAGNQKLKNYLQSSPGGKDVIDLT